MRNLLSIATAVTVLGASAMARDACPRPPATHLKTVATSRKSPFACNRLALTPAERKRHFDELGPMLLALKKRVRELPDGYEFEFPPDSKTFALVAEWSNQERLCCPFFDISMRLEREGGPLWLRLSGRPGTKEFIRVDGAKWIQQ